MISVACGCVRAARGNTLLPCVVSLGYGLRLAVAVEVGGYVERSGKGIESAFGGRVGFRIGEVGDHSVRISVVARERIVARLYPSVMDSITESVLHNGGSNGNFILKRRSFGCFVDRLLNIVYKRGKLCGNGSVVDGKADIVAVVIKSGGFRLRVSGYKASFALSGS